MKANFPGVEFLVTSPRFKKKKESKKKKIRLRVFTSQVTERNFT